METDRVIDRLLMGIVLPQSEAPIRHHHVFGRSRRPVHLFRYHVLSPVSVHEGDEVAVGRLDTGVAIAS